MRVDPILGYANIRIEMIAIGLDRRRGGGDKTVAEPSQYLVWLDQAVTKDRFFMPGAICALWWQCSSWR